MWQFTRGYFTKKHDTFGIHLAANGRFSLRFNKIYEQDSYWIAIQKVSREKRQTKHGQINDSNGWYNQDMDFNYVLLTQSTVPKCNGSKWGYWYTNVINSRINHQQYQKWVPPNHPFQWDFRLSTIQLLGYTHDYGNPHIAIWTFILDYKPH